MDPYYLSSWIHFLEGKNDPQNKIKEISCFEVLLLDVLFEGLRLLL
jgi:hypothetical protein